MVVSVSERPDFAAKSKSEFPSVVFYYGSADQTELLGRFDVAIIEPGHGFNPDHRPDSGTEWLAYISVGEVLDTSPYFDLIPKDWLIGKNDDWNAWVIDLHASEWPGFLVETVARPLWQRGYEGFFLDTMDSWLLLRGDQRLQARQLLGLARTIRALRQAFPQAVLVMNRGFELLPQIHKHVDALAFESLYRGWNERTKQYVEVRPKDRAWLLVQAAAARRSHLPVISLDYCSPQDLTGARTTMKRIREHGIVPSIGDCHLMTVHPGLMLQV
jgi:hypothetical protein